MIIFDCNGVLVDSEAIAATVAAQELGRAGFSVAPEVIARFFAGRRPTDMMADVEAATKRKLPENFATTLAAGGPALDASVVTIQASVYRRLWGR